MMPAKCWFKAFLWKLFCHHTCQLTNESPLRTVPSWAGIASHLNSPLLLVSVSPCHLLFIFFFDFQLTVYFKDCSEQLMMVPKCLVNTNKFAHTAQDEVEHLLWFSLLRMIPFIREYSGATRLVQMANSRASYLQISRHYHTKAYRLAIRVEISGCCYGFLDEVFSCSRLLLSSKIRFSW